MRRPQFDPVNRASLMSAGLLVAALAGSPAASGTLAWHGPDACSAARLRILRVKLTNLAGVRDTDVAALCETTNRIWAPYGFAIELGPDARAIAVVLTAGQDLAPPDRSRPVLGVTQFARGHALPFISLSLAAAEALAEEADLGVVPFRAESTEERSAILMRMLGVALAHELAHYLLDTMQHSAVGLLRAGFRTRELAFPDLAHVRLTLEQQRQLCAAGDAAECK
jgi:hypothetical protein